MTQETHKYITLWSKYKPAIVSLMNSLSNNEKNIFNLSEHEFIVVGDRASAGYNFNIQFKNGQVANNLNGSAVARDFKQVLLASKTVNALIRKNDYTIRLDQKFVPHIECHGIIETPE